MEDINSVLDGGDYFFYSTRLFLRPWKENLYSDKEDMRIVSIWIRLYSLLSEYWDSEILEDVGNNMGTFIKIFEQTKVKRYTAYARICVCIDLSKELLESIKMSWEDED